MKITICGSIAFIDEMVQAKEALESMGHEVQMPPTEIVNADGTLMPAKEYWALRRNTDTTEGWIWDRKQEAMKNHFKRVMWSDAILVLNESKHDIPHYVGPNTLMEMGLALHADKTIFLLNPIPEHVFKEEILGMKPTVLHGDLTQIS